MRSRSHGSSQNDMLIWPGFVDALSALLLVIMFVLLIFVVAQFYLNEILSGKDKSIDTFRNQIDQLSVQLNFLEDTKKILQTDLDKQRELDKKLNEKLEFLRRDYLASQEEIKREKDVSLSAKRELAMLNDQLSVFNDQIQKLNAALKASDETVQAQQVKIEKLSIDAALVKKVEEMAKYRSDFFESLEKALGDRDDIRVEGDRFMFQSEVLFDTGASTLENDGILTIDKLGESLKEIIEKIPVEVNWVLRVGGHTDKRPMRGKYQSNWELSFARAMAVVRRLVKKGIPANRLAATGFGANYPIDEAENDEAYKKNRRIEIKLDQR